MRPTSFESLQRLTWLATIAALIGAVLWFIGIPLAVISFNHSNAVAYSCLNHVLSELGFPYASRLTWVYNGTLTIGGLLLLPTLYALGVQLQTRLAWVAVSFGFITYLALSALGMYGLKQDILQGPYLFLPFLRNHLVIADVFFLGWLVTLTLFTILFCRRWTDPSARPMAVVGILSWPIYPVLLIAAIYANPMQAPLQKSLHDPAFRAIVGAPTSIAILSPWLDCHRPPVWWPAALEWALAWSMWVWFGMTLVFLWRRGAAGIINPGTRSGRAVRSSRFKVQ